MKHYIDPLVDCVFKALFGSEPNKNLLIHFVNAVLAPPPEGRITRVTLTNPINDKGHLSDKLSIVDVMAEDQLGRTLHIEVQLTTFPALPLRILYNWADIFAEQLKEGEDYKKVRPVVSIWVVRGRLLLTDDAFLHIFRMQEERTGVYLDPQSGVYILELPKWSEPKSEFAGELDRWIRFFNEGSHLDVDAPPPYFDTPEMRQAMGTLRAFSEREKNYHLYRRRVESQRVQSALEQARDDAEAELAAARAAVERAEEEIRKAESELSKAESELSKTESELSKTESELSKAESELSKTESELSKTASELSKTESELSKTESELSKTESELSKAEEARLAAEARSAELLKLLKEAGITPPNT